MSKDEPRCCIVAAARGWIDTPFVHQASLKGVGCDCLGLIRGVWRELIGAEPGDIPAYAFDWAEARGEELMYGAFARHMVEIAKQDVAAGDVALFRMAHHGPAKHCAIVGERDARGAERPEGETGKQKACLTLIHSRANRRVREEEFSPAWRRPTTFAYAFRFRGFS